MERARYHARMAVSAAKIQLHGLQLYERHGRHLPAAVSVLLVVIIAWTLAALLWALVPTPEAARWQPAPASTAAGSAPAAKGPDVAFIASAKLFGDYQAAAVADVSTAPDTNLSLTLLGILSGSTDYDSRALIGTQGGTEEPYAIGEDITPGVTLHAIFPDRVILSRSGAYETLRLDKDKPSTAVADSGSAPAPAGAVDANAPPGQMLGQIREQILQDPSKAGEYIRVQPANISGALRGYRIYPGRDRTMFGNLGLRPGDLITAVNGIQLDDGQKALQTLNELKQAASVSLTIERGGQPQTVTLSLN